MKIRNNFIPSTFNLFNSIPSAFLRNSLLALICSLFLFTSISSALANRQSGESHKNPAAEKLTNALGALLHQYQNARGAEKDQLLEDLMAAAARRQEILSSIIAENPGEVLRLAVPKKVKANMPKTVQAMIEEHLSVTGELEVLDEDYPDGSHRLRHFLRAGDKRYALNFKNTPKNLLTGTQVNANGVLVAGNGKSDGAIALGSDENLITLAAGGDESTTTSSVGSDDTLPNTLGEQSTVVLLVNFQDDPTNKPWTLSEVENLVFGTVNDFYVENSFGQTWLSGDVFGWYTLPVDSTSFNEIATQADLAATAAGVDMSTYQRIIYMFPDITAFSFAGLGTVGGTPSRSWINGAFDLRIVGHELGHNFGLYHAHGLDCGDTTLGSECSVGEYADPFDIMGARASHFTSFHKERLGWFNDESPVGIMEVENDGMYTMEPYETFPGVEPNSLKILKSIDSATGLKTWYYLEYRQAIGFDDWLAEENFWYDTDNVLNGVVVHIGTETTPNSSFLLDMTPNSTLNFDLFDSALVTGSSFSDPDTGTTITTDWVDSSSVDVVVTTGSQAVVSFSDPGLVLSPAESPWVTPGTLVSYIVTVTNNDTGLTSQFDLEATAPIGWSARVSNSSVTLSPGESTSVTLDVTSSTSAENGFYDIGVSVENSSDPTFNASGTVTYIVVYDGGDEPTPATDTDVPPVADAGEDINVTDADMDSVESIQLDGNGSYDTDGTIVSYDWYEDDNHIANGASAVVSFKRGSHKVKLAVTDNSGLVSNDEVLIDITEGVLAPPTNLAATVSGNTFTLAWSDSGSESGYYIEQGEKIRGKIVFNRVMVADTDVTTYVGTFSAGTYYFRVKAFGEDNAVSDYSNTIQVRIKR